MKTQKHTINCPECGHEIDVNELVTHQIEEKLKKDYAEKTKVLNDKISNQEALITQKVEEAKKQAVAGLKAQLKKEVLEENEDAMKTLQKELNEKSDQLKEFNRLKADMSKLQRDKDGLQEKLEAENQIKLNAEIEKVKKEAKENAENESELKIKALQKKLDDQGDLIKQMKRKQEQGSMQLQGEVQELAIEDFLRSNFPLDDIEPIAKGVRGADCLQIVKTHQNPNCGTIYYESKRTKNFNNEWIEKFKQDMLEKGADIGVLITETMPRDKERMHFRDGIFICNFQEFKGLVGILRVMLIRISLNKEAQVNKGQKMEMLYAYLTGSEFRMHVEAIIEGFTRMQEDLTKERRVMHKHWKKREKEIEKVMLNTSSMFGSIKGIAGPAIPEVRGLELDYITEDALPEESE